MANTKVSSEQIIDDVALAGNPTTTTQGASDNSTKVATTAYVTTAVSNLVDSAPSSLNTLNELAAAMSDNASFFSTVLPLSGGTMSGALNMGSQNITNAGTISSGAITATGTSTFATSVSAGTTSNTDTLHLYKFQADHGIRIQGSSSNWYIYNEYSDGGKLHITDNTSQDTITVDTAGNTTISGTISSGAITSSGAVKVTGQNLAHATNTLTIGQEGSGAAQFRAYGSNASTQGSMEFELSASDGSPSTTALLLNSSGNATFSGTISSGAITSTGNIQATSFTVGTSNDAGEALNILDGGHTGQGAANTVSLASFAENVSGNSSGVWIGSMTNENTAIIGTRTASGNLGFQTYDGAWGERMRLTNTGDVLIGSSTNLNTLSGTPKLQIGSGTGHASLQFYSGTSSVNGIYFGDTSSANVDRYDGYIEYQHANRLISFRASGVNPLTLKSTGPLLPAGDFGYHTTQEHYTASSNPSSYSTASNITYTSSTQYWPDQGEKLICVVNARAYTKYIHIKTNLTANSIMFFFRTKGYFYGYGCEEQLIGGYTYTSNSVISKSNETVAGNTHTGDTYRASDGSLVLKMDVNQTGYTEGKMLVFFHAHAPSTTSGLTVTAVTQKDDGTNAF
jgi:hypothetical protein